MASDKIKGWLISESSMESTPEILSDKSGEHPTVIKVILQEGDIKNRNGRIYPTSVIKKSLMSEYIQERLSSKSWYGEAGHPLMPKVERQLYIDQSNISHIITGTEWRENMLYGTVETALTARGKDFQGLIRQGSKVAFSMRGYGPVCEKVGDVVKIKDPLHILTYDWVIHPSHKPAYMQEVLREDTDLMGFNSKSNALSESGYFIPITQDMIAQEILSENSNLSSMLEQLEFSPDSTSMSVDRSKRILYFRESNDILATFLDDYITHDLDRYLSQL